MTTESTPQPDKYVAFAERFRILAENSTGALNTKAHHDLLVLIVGELDDTPEIQTVEAHEKLSISVFTAFDAANLYLSRFKENFSEALHEGSVRLTDSDVSSFFQAVGHLATHLIRTPGEGRDARTNMNIEYASK